MISEPHFMGQSKSCIDLIFTYQPNLFLKTGVHPTLHEQCHHQVVYGKLAVNNLAPPTYTRRIWFYDRANVTAVRRSIEMFRWRETLDEVSCPNQQVSILNEVLLNIFSNFIPNKVTTVRPRKAPWITTAIKNFIRKKKSSIQVLYQKWSATRETGRNPTHGFSRMQINRGCKT